MQRPRRGSGLVPNALRGLLALAFLAGSEAAALNARTSAFLAREVSQKIKLRRQTQNPRVDWNYEMHGSNWPGLCGTDTRQSPIALPALATLSNTTETLWYRYPNYEEPVEVYNDGLALTVTFHQKIGGVGVGPRFENVHSSWSLHQMTIHAPSEHTWAGVHVPLEVQLVHTPSHPGADLAIVSIGFTRGPMNTVQRFLDTLVAEGLPVYKGDEVKTNMVYGQALPFWELFTNSEFLSYDGSISQPPCTPNAKYFVRDQPIDADPETLEKFLHNIALSTGVPDGNFRVPQPLNGRNVTRLITKDGSNLATAEDVMRQAIMEGPPTQAPSVPLLDSEKDVDHEDATRETEEVKLHYWYSDPTGDIVRAEKDKADSANDILHAYNETMVREKPDAIVDEMPTVVQARGEVEGATVELTEAQTLLDKANAALILAKQGRDFAEGRTNLTEAESAFMSAQDEVHAKQQVVDALQSKVNNAKNLLADAKGEGHAQVWWAQKQLEHFGNNLPGNAGVEPTVPMSYELPTGPYTDPFSAHNAELRSRIKEKSLPEHLSQALGPNHIHVAGTVVVGQTEEEDPVVTPQPLAVESPSEEEAPVVES